MLVSQLEINMDSIRTLHPLTRAWLLDGPLSAHLDGYLTLLERGRYAEGSIEKHLRALAHFAHWMTRCRLAARWSRLVTTRESRSWSSTAVREVRR